MPLAETFYGMTAKGYTSNEILREINAKLKFILPVEMFCCAALLDINLRQGVLRVWNGGLPDGYLLNGAAGGRVAVRPGNGHLVTEVVGTKPKWIEGLASRCGVHEARCLAS